MTQAVARHLPIQVCCTGCQLEDCHWADTAAALPVKYWQQQTGVYAAALCCALAGIFRCMIVGAVAGAVCVHLCLRQGLTQAVVSKYPADAAGGVAAFT
jgi:hypothetical protein